MEKTKLKRAVLRDFQWKMDEACVGVVRDGWDLDVMRMETNTKYDEDTHN